MTLCLWGIIRLQVLALIAGFSILPNASYALSNFALYGKIYVSPNNTCGLQRKEEFCSAVDEHLHCRQLGLCDARCSFAENSPGGLDLVATGIFTGEVT